MNNLEKDKQNIRKYLDMYFKGKPAVDNIKNAFTLLRKIYEYAEEGFRHEYPFDITWEITSGCNLRCKHCYIKSRENAFNTNNDMNPEDAIYIAKNIGEFFEACYVTLTGGEPLLHPKFMDIVSILKDYRISTYIQTNATLLDDKKIKKLSEILNPNFDIIQVSLDGVGNLHNEIRNKNIYKTVFTNIKKLIKHNIFVSVNCTITSINYNEIIDLFLLCNKIGVKRFTLTKLIANVEEQKKFIPEDKKVFEIIAKIIELKEQENLPIIINPICYKFVELVNIPLVKEVLNEYKQYWRNDKHNICLNCHNGEKLSIKADGKLYLCPEVISEQALLGDLKENSIDNIWENIWEHPLYQKREICKMECKNCKYVTKCQAGCMGENYIKTGNIFSKSPICKINNINND